MGGLKEFIIPFIGLKDGNHEYRFGINDSFFEAFPFSEITKGDIRVDVELIRRPTMLTFNIRLEGEASLPCDRCGNEYRQPVQGQWQIVVNLNGDTFNDEDDLITLPAGAYEFDLSQYVYEYLVLLMPQRRVCGEPPDPTRGDCDPEILAKLNELQPGAERDDSDDDKGNSSDPRWDSLKDIKFD